MFHEHVNNIQTLHNLSHACLMHKSPSCRPPLRCHSYRTQRWGLFYFSCLAAACLKQTSWGRGSLLSHLLRMRSPKQTASLCSERWWLFWMSREMSCNTPNSNWCTYRKHRVCVAAWWQILELYVSYSTLHCVICIFYCIEQPYVQTVADSQLEELWNQLDALKKGYTGRVKIKA